MTKRTVRKTWRQKMEGAPNPHITVLERDFAGYPAGSRLLISSPSEVAAAIRQIPKGELWTVKQLRDHLASAWQDAHSSDAQGSDAQGSGARGSGAQGYEVAGTCPLTTGIFLRIAAELAWEECEGGVPIEQVTPFWRVISPNDPLAKKLACGLDFLAERRVAEA